MAQFRANIVSNYFGRIWLAVTNVVAVPLYVKFMGVESYGLVGFFAMLQAAFSILDIGLYTTVNRELARIIKLKGKEQQSRDLIRTLEFVYWAFAVGIVIVVSLSAPYISTHWLKPQALSRKTVANAIMIMGFAMALEAPYSLYYSSLMGLQRQPLVNWVNSAFATLRCVGAISILWLVSPSVEAYFLWQIPVSGAKTIVMAIYLQRALPKTSRRANFRKEQLKSLWRFSLGVSGMAVLALILTQADKVLLSRLLPLEMFGYYSLAWVLAFSMVGLLVDPVKDATFPRFSQYVEMGDSKAITELYHFSCQAASTMLFPVCMVAALFPYEILLIWTGNPVTAQNTCTILEFLVVGMALRGLMTIPTVMQLAYGWTKLLIGLNFVAALIFIPLVIALTTAKGALGAASAWIFLYSGYVFFGIAAMHKRILRGEQRVWYFTDVGPPLLASLVIGCICRLIAPLEMSRVSTVAFLALALILSITASAFSAPQIRAWLKRRSTSVGALVGERLRALSDN